MSENRAERWMRRAIELSRRGFPAPNPHVGCVIVREDRIVGEGFHAYAGGPHAEVAALDAAGKEALGSEVFVTLEPCDHQGRTGPCSNALIEAEVSSVSYAIAEPNARAKGGAERLRQAGIAVECGLLASEAADANEPFLTAMRLSRPFVALKAAITLDGFLAMTDGESKWITGEQARRTGRVLRAEMGAVLVGAGTVLRDDPTLVANIGDVVNQPLKVVLDPEGAIPSNAHLYKGGPVLRFVETKERSEDVELPLHGVGFEVGAILRALWDRGVTSLLVEGGAHTLGSFLESGLFDRLELFLAPKILGSGITWSGGYRADNLDEALGLKIRFAHAVGVDMHLGYRRES